MTIVARRLRRHGNGIDKRRRDVGTGSKSARTIWIAPRELTVPDTVVAAAPMTGFENSEDAAHPCAFDAGDVPIDVAACPFE